LTWKRPAHGISPKFMNDLLGQKATSDIAEDTVLQWRYFGE
jgi:N-acetylneuraminate synthase